MTLYKQKYRVETNRFRSHAYSEGMYFVTICTQKKMQWFGELREGKVVLSKVGNSVEKCIRAVPKHFLHAKVDAFVVMPNHVHILIAIMPSGRDVTVETRESRVSTKEASHQNKPDKKFMLKSKTLGSIVNQFKGVVTKRAKAEGLTDFQWQPRYHDRIIRSQEEWTAVKAYIARNPDAWDKETIPWHADAAFYSL